MIRRPPRSTQGRSSAASDVYKRQLYVGRAPYRVVVIPPETLTLLRGTVDLLEAYLAAVSYTHLRAHETVLEIVCRLLLEKKKQSDTYFSSYVFHPYR